MQKRKYKMQDIGLVGLAVMGQNLALNMAEKGWSVSVFNRTSSKVDAFLEGEARGTGIVGFSDFEGFIASLKRPRKVILMVKAGPAVDSLICQALPFLEEGDILIDGGNSYFHDTKRRVEEAQKHGVLYVGAGISGGEEGARHGPSIMPGGSVEAWPEIKDIFQSISAHVGKAPCCEWLGEGGSGHYVKMVHNGIEYADMQLIAESYDLLHRGLNCSAEELASIFSRWNRSHLNSYLIEITAKIFGKKDVDGAPLVDKILDVAGQKGTGKWTVASALDLSIPLSLVGEAVFTRYLSARIEDRQKTAEAIGDEVKRLKITKNSFCKRLEKALYAAKIISYAQGFYLMHQASREYGWKINLGACALMWRGGCIIRSAFLGKIKEAYDLDPDLSLLILDPFFKKALSRSIDSLRRVVVAGALHGIPLPCFSAALSWYDGVRSRRLPTNLLQAQRDLFGAHTFERTDKPRGHMFHADWAGEE